MPYLLAFLYGVVLDFAYVRWFIAANDNNRPRAAMWTALYYIPSLLGYVAVFENRLLMGPFVAGAMLGVVLGMRPKSE